MKSHECPATKQCTGCGEEKPQTEFTRTRPRCKTCESAASRERYLRNRKDRLAKCAEYRKANKDRIKRYLADWYEQNRDHVLTRCKEYNSRPEVKARERVRQAKRYAAMRLDIQEQRRQYYETHPEAKARFLEYQKQYYKENKPKFQARVGKRRAARMRATPKWANIKAIAEIYATAAEMTASNGTRYVVDHIIPLQGRKVCGLHVEANLQVIPELDNLRKFNKFG